MSMSRVVLSWMDDAAREFRLRAKRAREAYPTMRWGVPSADAYDECATVMERHARAYEATLPIELAPPPSPE